MKSAVYLCLVLASLLAASQADVTTPTVSTDSSQGTTSLDSGDNSTETASKSPEQTKEHVKEKFSTLLEGCKKITKIPKEQIKIATNFGIPSTEEERCFLNCIYDGLNLTKDGKFNDEGALALAKMRFGTSAEDMGRARRMIDHCKEEAIVKDTSEKCAIGKVLRECIVKYGSEINFFPKAF